MSSVCGYGKWAPEEEEAFRDLPSGWWCGTENAKKPHKLLPKGLLLWEVLEKNTQKELRAKPYQNYSDREASSKRDHPSGRSIPEIPPKPGELKTELLGLKARTSKVQTSQQ
ncbi:PREDICTED: uncharacterized protein C12orf73 homolog [Apaloderma vittatum]|uniref:uncharacterized protein C12orf73 homolog n=1 Tax=Apaloderma vittatum TaxID=57397 RepID=UPI0005212A1C|nr:PREDICTED: uncharacterized protein C12orf73 homolog [Apaloderma vittatum]